LCRTKPFRGDAEGNYRRRFFKAFCTQHLNHCFATSIGSGHTPEGALLKPAKWGRVVMKNVLVSLHDNGNPRRKPATQRQYLCTRNAVRLMAHVDQMRA